MSVPSPVRSLPVLVLALGTFAVGTDAFVVAGLLGEIASSVSVPVSAAGQIITVFSLAYAVLAPVTATLTARWSRRTVLLVALGVFAAGNVLTAVAPDYPVLIVSRVVAAAGAALVTPTSSITAAALVPEAARARAISVAVSGLTISTALGSPLGTAVGALAGWRVTMAAVAGLGLLAALGIVLVLPPVPGSRPVPLRERLGALSDRSVLLVLTTTLVSFLAIYVVYSYASEIFGPATGGDGERLAVVLLAFGVAAVAGNVAAGVLADRFGPVRVVNVAVAGLAAGCASLVLTRTDFPAALVSIAVIGFSAFAVTSPQQHRLISRRPEEPAVVVSLNASFTYLSVAVAAGVGGLLLIAPGVAALPPAAALFALGGLACSAVALRVARRTDRGRATVPAYGGGGPSSDDDRGLAE